MCHGALGSRINSDIVAVLACQQCWAQFKFSAVGRGYLYMTSMGSDLDRLVLTDEEKAYNDPRLWQQIDEKSPRQVVRARDVSSDGTAPRDNYQVPFGREREEILGQVALKLVLRKRASLILITMAPRIRAIPKGVNKTATKKRAALGDRDNGRQYPFIGGNVHSF